VHIKNRTTIILIAAIAVAVSLAYMSPNFGSMQEVSVQAVEDNVALNEVCESVDVREPLETNVLKVRNTFKTVIAEKEIFSCIVGGDPQFRAMKEVTLIIETLETNKSPAGAIPVFETRKNVEVILCAKNLDVIQSPVGPISPISVPCIQYSPPRLISGAILGCDTPVVLDDPIAMQSASIDSKRKTANGIIKQTLVKTVIVEKEIIPCDVEERDASGIIIRTAKDIFDVFIIEEIIEQAIEPNPPTVVAKYFELIKCQKDAFGNVLGCVVTDSVPIEPRFEDQQPYLHYFDGKFL